MVLGLLASVLWALPAAAAPFAYVTNSGDSNVSVIDTAPTVINMVVATVTVGTSPQGVAITPNGTRAYVTNFGDGIVPGTVSVIDTATNMVVATVTVGRGPVGVAIIPDGTHAYVTNSLDSTVSVLATATNLVVATIPVGRNPQGVAITPSPLDQMNTLMAFVQALITAGTLNDDQGNTLLGPLQSAEAFLTQGRPLQAINQMQEFSTNVTSLLNDGVLTPRQALLLIHGANAVNHALGA